MCKSSDEKQPYFMISFDRQWHCTFLDTGAEKLFQRQREELLGRSMLTVFPNFEITSMYQLGLRVMQEQSKREFTTNSIPFHGWTHVDLYPALAGLHVLLQAVAQPEEAKGQEVEPLESALLREQLRESQERLQLLQQATGVGIFEWDIQSGRVIWSEEAEERFGLRPGEFAGTLEAWEQLVHPDDLPLARATLYETVEKRQPLDMQFRVIWPDQSIHWIYAKARTFYDQQDKPLRMLGINIDLTEHKRTEKEIEVYKEKLRLFAESNVIGLLFSDIYGNITYANDAFLNLIGYTRAELEAGQIRWTDLTPPEWASIDQQKIALAQRDGICTVYEKEYLHKNGSRINILIGYNLFGERREQAVTFVLDITERKRLEKQKDEFIGVVSHELRTPVTSLKAFAQVLEQRFQRAGDRQNAAFLAKMDTQLTRLTRLIGDLIDITKLEAGKLQLHLGEFELMPLVEEVVEEMQHTTRQQLLIAEKIAQGKVYGDRDRIGQVIFNLLSNALKYAPQAEMTIIRVTRDEKEATVSIQDFGLGIPPEKQGQIFQRFYRVDEKRLETIPGMGLGLYISAEMIQRHGGRIWFVSEGGHGSTFSFCVPLQSSEQNARNVLSEEGVNDADDQENSACG
jgi:PAS domain S-box-containing protein